MYGWQSGAFQRKAPCGVQCAAGAKELQKLTMIYAAKLLQIAAKCVFHNSNY